MIETSRKHLLWELSTVTAALLLFARGLFYLRHVAIIDRNMSVIIALVFIYTPIAVLGFRRRPMDFVDTSWRAFCRSVLLFLMASVIVFPPFFLAAHGWQTVVMGRHWAGMASAPTLFFVFVQVVVVALYEEFYFRGYFQTTMDIAFGRPWRMLGAGLGWGWIITAGVFAVAHTIVYYRWWHFAIFFPALIFGYLRERTGSIVAPILFHAASNVLMDWFARFYI